MSVTLPYCRTIVLPGWGECADNRIGVEGAKAIAEALSTNTTLTTLYLGGELFCMILSAAPHASHKYHVCDPAVLSYCRTIVLSYCHTIVLSCGRCQGEDIRFVR